MLRFDRLIKSPVPVKHGQIKLIQLAFKTEYFFLLTALSFKELANVRAFGLVILVLNFFNLCVEMF